MRREAILNTARVIVSTDEADVIDLDEVWKTATSDVPAELIKIEPLLPRRPGERS